MSDDIIIFSIFIFSLYIFCLFFFNIFYFILSIINHITLLLYIIIDEDESCYELANFYRNITTTLLLLLYYYHIN